MFMKDEIPVQEASTTSSRLCKLIGRAGTKPSTLTPGPGAFCLCILQTHYKSVSWFLSVVSQVRHGTGTGVWRHSTFPGKIERECQTAVLESSA